MLGRFELRRYAWFIVILKEVGHAGPVGLRNAEVLNKSIRLVMDEPVVERFVVGIGKAVLLKPGLVIPVHLGEKEKARVITVNRLDRLWPEGVVKGLLTLRAISPCAVKHLRLQKHRHIAAHPGAARRDVSQLSYHRRAKVGIEEIELYRVGPSREIRVLSEGDDRFIGKLDPPIRGEREIGWSASDEKVRPLPDPAMVKAYVIRNEVKEEVDTPKLQALSEAGELHIASDRWFCSVFTHRKGRAAYVILFQVWKHRFVLAVPLSSLPRYLSTRWTDLPHAEKPYPIESPRREVIEKGVRDIVERGVSAKGRKKCLCVDLVEAGIHPSSIAVR